MTAVFDGFLPDTAVKEVCVANAKDQSVRVDGVRVAQSRDCRIVIEGAHIDLCSLAFEYADGTVWARCFVKRDGRYLLTKDRKHILQIVRTGRGHIFYPRCCK